jgi:vacuolar iron transporter family protein
MIPYFAMNKAAHALFVSIGITFVVLLVFGYMRGRLTVQGQRAAIFSAFQTLFVGALAAAVSYGIVRAINSKGGTSI